MSKKQDKTLLNEQINLPEVRCIGDNGDQYGLISSKEAQQIAFDQGVDLVLIAPDAKPPVAKVMDYGKFKYQQEKKQKEARKKQKTIDVKEIKLTVKIAQNDINFKVKHAIEFLEKGKHVKFRVFLKGREMSTPEAGFDVLEKVKEMITDHGKVDKDSNRDGRFVNMYVVPINEKTKN
ncbi:MAG: translation initiation factor IF-3 [Campylobacterales bacterium]|nr:translation initiation factor IF-3 [Campylobacterales bacterium]